MFWKKKDNVMRIDQPMLIAQRVEDPNGTLTVHLDPGQLGSPEEAGLMLADIGRHMARALASTGYEGDENDAFAKLTNMFNAEAKSPTQPIAGSLVQ